MLVCVCYCGGSSPCCLFLGCSFVRFVVRLVGWCVSSYSSLLFGRVIGRLRI